MPLCIRTGPTVRPISGAAPTYTLIPRRSGVEQMTLLGGWMSAQGCAGDHAARVTGCCRRPVGAACKCGQGGNTGHLGRLVWGSVLDENHGQPFVPLPATASQVARAAELHTPDEAAMNPTPPALKLLLVLAVLPALALTACGANMTSRTVTIRHAVKPGPPAAVRPAITTSDSAPTYCTAMSRSKAVLRLSAAVDRLAQTPDDAAARSTIQRAAAAFASAASGTTGAPRAALQTVASALETLDQEGLTAAGSSVSDALQNLGATLEIPCSYPVG
jgi:hypothetical protein